jgi:hypothetical protein
VAYWNLASRKITFTNGRGFINGSPLRFFHFSGVDPNHLDAISKYQNRFTLANVPECRPLLEAYRDLLELQGYHEVKNWPWAYACFDNGVKISELARKIYRESSRLQGRYPDPFATHDSDSYFEWVASSVGFHPIGLARLVVTLASRSLQTIHKQGMMPFLQLLFRRISELESRDWK